MLLPNEILDSLPNPINIVAELDKYIIGQADAKKNLGVLLLVRALMRLQHNGIIDSTIDLQKTNLLLLGPTGCGKTGLIRALSEISDIPIPVVDVTSITAAGYIGNKVEDILVDYVNKIHKHYSQKMIVLEASNDASTKTLFKDILQDALEFGIVYIDEIDKIRIRATHGIDVNGDMVQNELLKLLEGDIVKLTSARGSYPSGGVRELNTKNIFFICGGAFANLDEIINKRLSKSAGIGFGSDLPRYAGLDNQGIYSEVKTEDLLEYGFKPEFLGRLPLRACLNGLSKEDMVKIITQPKNAIYLRYVEFFKLFGVSLNITSRGIAKIAEHAISLNLGARSLHQIFNDLFLDDLYTVRQHKELTILIDEYAVEKRLIK